MENDCTIINIILYSFTIIFVWEWCKWLLLSRKDLNSTDNQALKSNDKIIGILTNEVENNQSGSNSISVAVKQHNENKSLLKEKLENVISERQLTMKNDEMRLNNTLIDKHDAEENIFEKNVHDLDSKDWEYLYTEAMKYVNNYETQKH